MEFVQHAGEATRPLGAVSHPIDVVGVGESQSPPTCAGLVDAFREIVEGRPVLSSLLGKKVPRLLTVGI